MNIKIFSDGANLNDIKNAAHDSMISGITTNPTLMAKEGIKDYLAFAEKALSFTNNKSFSLEVFSDEFGEMERQARILAKLGDNVFVKIPVVNSIGIPTYEVVKKLSSDGIKLNVTAIFTREQIDSVVSSLDYGVPAYISIFAGRIADAGFDPELTVQHCAESKSSSHEIIWASPREAFNCIQAERSGAEIITATPDLIKKFRSFGRDLHEFSIETSKMFYDDAVASGFKL